MSKSYKTFFYINSYDGIIHGSASKILQSYGYLQLFLCEDFKETQEEICLQRGFVLTSTYARLGILERFILKTFHLTHISG